ncbi:MAG: hypothetical protein EA360_09970 [Balneolaceae bacterium]|nr:MAG: hypothetical protein EA360_09970 [Balneolaceae bacterium]
MVFQLSGVYSKIRWKMYGIVQASAMYFRKRGIQCDLRQSFVSLNKQNSGNFKMNPARWKS